MYLDTGAMYRAIGLSMKRDGIDLADPAAVAGAVNDVDISVAYEGGSQHIYLGREDVSRAIREPEVSLAASAVSAVPEVRERMVALQREIAKGHSVVMDGRDIGTVVLPDATVKIYLTASAEVRARRRFDELAAKGRPEPFQKVLDEMVARDYNDSHRAASPLRPAEDARCVDTSDMTRQQVVDHILAIVHAVAD